MKFGIIIFIMLVMNLFLVCGFESEVYHIGVEVPAGDSDAVVVNSVTPSGGSGGSGGGGGGGSRSVGNVSVVMNDSGDSGSGDGDGMSFDSEGFSKGSFEEEGFFSAVTGAVVGAVGVEGVAVAGIFIAVVLGSLVFVRVRKK